MTDTLWWAVTVLGLAGAGVGFTVAFTHWREQVLVRMWREQLRLIAAPPPPAPINPANLAWLQEQYDRIKAELEAQQRAEQREIRAQLRQNRAYAVEVTEAYQRLCSLYAAMRRHIEVMDAHLQTWPEVTKDLPTYSAADPPPLPTPPWLQEEPAA